MMEQFDPYEYEQTIDDLGRDTLSRLQCAIDNENLAILDGVEAVTDIIEYNTVGVATLVRTTYTSNVFEQINPAVIDQPAPPQYLMSSLVTLSESLVDHLNDRYAPNGVNPLFTPSNSQLRNHIQGVWFTIPRQEVGDGYSVPLFSAEKGRSIELNLVKVPGDYGWNVVFQCSEDKVLLRSLLAERGGEVEIANRYRIPRCILKLIKQGD